MSDHPEQDLEYENHLRLMASEVIVTLFNAKNISQLTLLKIAVDRALELLASKGK